MRPLQPGELVLIWYATRPKRKGGTTKCELMPLHNRIGTVKTCPSGRGPKNYGVIVDGDEHCIPRGNLVPKGSWARY